MKRTFIPTVIMSGLLWVLVCFPSESVRAQNVDVPGAFFPDESEHDVLSGNGGSWVSGLATGNRCGD